MKNKNIILGYVLVALNNAFFWYAPWLLFIYQFIDIKQAALLQLIGLATRIVSEVPTGVVGDLLGKKKTLFVAFLLTAVGELTMAFSSTFTNFAFSYIITNLGYSFYSGTIDAYFYDSLVEKKQVSKYQSVLGKSTAYQSISTAVATLTGGLLYQIWGGLPFLVTGIIKLVGVGVVFLIKEPSVDTFSFSPANFMRQTILGLKHLFGVKLIKLTLLIVLMGSFSTVAYEILDDMAVVDWGYTASGISLLYTATIILSIPSSFFYGRISKMAKPQLIVTLGIIILAANYLFAPLINTLIWTLIFLIRVVYSPLKKAAVTDIINSSVASNIRATTLSTYELIIRIPFLLMGVAVADSLKIFGVKYFSVVFSGSLLALLLIYLVISFLKKPTFKIT